MPDGVSQPPSSLAQILGANVEGLIKCIVGVLLFLFFEVSVVFCLYSVLICNNF